MQASSPLSRRHRELSLLAANNLGVPLLQSLATGVTEVFRMASDRLDIAADLDLDLLIAVGALVILPVAGGTDPVTVVTPPLVVAMMIETAMVVVGTTIVSVVLKVAVAEAPRLLTASLILRDGSIMTPMCPTAISKSTAELSLSVV
jgi:hypothetical protein